MKPLHQILFCLCIAFLSTSNLIAQKQEKAIFIELQLKDDSRIKGKQISLSNDTIVLQILNQGEESIAISNIKRMRRVRSPKSTNIAQSEWFDSPNRSRNLYANTGYGLPSGEGYYQNIWAFLNNFQFGLSDYFSMGIQFETATTFESITDDIVDFTFPAFLLNPQFSFPVSPNKLNIGLGVQVIGIPDEDHTLDLVAINGVMTLGNPDRNITGGIAFGFLEGKFTPLATVSIAGSYRIGNQFALVTDNTIYFDPMNDTYLAFAIGLQTTGKKGTSWDFSFVGVGDEFGFWPSPLPLIGFKVPFKFAN